MNIGPTELVLVLIMLLIPILAVVAVVVAVRIAGTRACPACQTKVPRAATTCSRCGAALGT